MKNNINGFYICIWSYLIWVKIVTKIWTATCTSHVYSNGLCSIRYFIRFIERNTLYRCHSIYKWRPGHCKMFHWNFKPLIGMCSFTHPVFHNIGNLLLFVLPAVLVTIFSIFKIIKLMRAISIQPSSFPNKAANSEPILRRRAAKKGLR